MQIIRHYFDWTDPASQIVFEKETDNLKIDERFHKQAANLIRYFDLSKGDLILDYGCGIGKHAVCLKKKGYNVIGYDISKHYINKAREIMKNEGVDLEFHASDEFLVEFYGRFDFIYTVAFPFYYLNEEAINTLLSKIKKLLSKNGKFLFGFPYTRENREHFLPRNSWQEKNGLLHLTDESMNKEGNRTERYMIIDLENDTVTEWIDKNKYYYVHEIQQFLSGSGFTILDQFDNLERKAPNSDMDVHFLLCK